MKLIGIWETKFSRSDKQNMLVLFSNGKGYCKTWDYGNNVPVLIKTKLKWNLFFFNRISIEKDEKDFKNNDYQKFTYKLELVKLNEELHYKLTNPKSKISVLNEGFFWKIFGDLYKI